VIDSHCHLFFKSIRNDFNNILYRAKNNNIKTILSINTNPLEFNEHLNLIKNYQNIYISYGLHPDEVNEKSNISVENLILNCKHDKVIGLGETGLDFYYSKKNKIKQYEIFEKHIEASIKTSIPLIIHQRNSENEIINLLKKHQRKCDLSLVFHCFTGSKNLLNFCLDNNYFISLSGIVTFKNASNLREIIKDISLDQLLIETDSPFLSPMPMRGKDNEPSYIKYTFEYLSDFFSIPLNKFIEITDNNFYKLFSKAKRYTYPE
tara:strand:- start:6227 stop:7015 length:789 start_codon:yes stop_codon:yes gene_type:complete